MEPVEEEVALRTASRAYINSATPGSSLRSLPSSRGIGHVQLTAGLNSAHSAVLPIPPGRKLKTPAPIRIWARGMKEDMK